MALAVVPGLASAGMWVLAVVIGSGPLHDSDVVVLGLPAVVSAAVVYALTSRTRVAWALGAAAAAVGWFFVIYIAVIFIVKPD